MFAFYKRLLGLNNVCVVYENRGQRGEDFIGEKLTMLSIPSFKVLVKRCQNMVISQLIVRYIKRQQLG